MPREELSIRKTQSRYVWSALFSPVYHLSFVLQLNDWVLDVYHLGKHNLKWEDPECHTVQSIQYILRLSAKNWCADGTRLICQERIRLWFILWAPWMCVQIHPLVKTCCLMPGGWNESPPFASLLPTSVCWFLEEPHQPPDISSAVFLYRQRSQSTARTTSWPNKTHTHWLTSIKGTVNVKGGNESKTYLKMLSSRCDCWHSVLSCPYGKMKEYRIMGNMGFLLRRLCSICHLTNVM